MKVSLLVLATLFLIMPQAFSDSVTLNSGEVIQGDILSETETELVMMAVNYNRTITSRRTILKSEIAKVDRESTQQKVERRAYEALADRLRLDSNRELGKAEYESGIEAFNNYLTTYPESKHVGDVRKRQALWKDELSRVEQGEVKFADKWMSPEEKRPLLLKKQLADLERQRDSLAVSVAGAEGRLPGLQTKLATLQDTQEPVYENRLVGRNHYSQSYFTGQYKIVSNPERPKVQAEIISCQQSISSGRATLVSLDNRIRDVRSQILEIQHAQEAALAKSKQEAVQAAAEQPAAAPEQAAPETPPPPVAAPNSWLKENWKWLAGGAAALIIVVGYFVSRFTANRVIAQLAEEESRLRDERLAKRREAELAGRPTGVGEEDPPGEQ